MGEHIYKSDNKTLLLYHLFFPLKYRKKVVIEEIGEGLKEICIEICKRHEINFVGIGYEEDHVHFLIQSVPSNSVEKLIRTIKSITAKELLEDFQK
jgi:putative transposase